MLLPAGWNDGRLCFEVRGRDGRYYGENEYKIPIKPKTATFVFLPYESDKLGNTNRNADDTAPLAYSGSCTRSVDQPFKPLPVIWGSPNSNVVDNIVIFANLGRDGDVTSTMNDQSGRCEYLPGGGAAYDWKCTFSLVGQHVKSCEVIITQTLFEDRNTHRITINLGN